MTISAVDGAVVVFPETPGNSNPDYGPSCFNHGYGLIDGRAPFQYSIGGNAPVYQWASASFPVIDQVPSAAAANNIALSQSPGAGAIVLTAGTGVTASSSVVNASTGATVTGLLALDGAMGYQTYGNSNIIRAWDPTKAVSRAVRIVSGSDDSLITFTVNGYDIYGYPLTEALTGTNAGTATGKKAFKYIRSVTHTGSVAGTVTVGTTDIIGLPVQILRLPYVSAWWGNPQTQAIGGGIADQTVITIPVTMSALANGQAYAVQVPFDGKIVGINFNDTVAVTTAAKAATLTAQANGSSVTAGGALALSGTYAIGAGATGTAATAGNTFTAGQTVGFVVSGVTTFVEGAGVVQLVVQNTDSSGGTFTAAVTTSPATTTTGDARGTLLLPSASDAAKRLTVLATIPPASLAAYTGAASVFGVAQV